MSIDSLRTNAFECIDDLNDYEEFRIHSPRFLFYGSNMVMNPNRYFFQYEQPLFQMIIYVFMQMVVQHVM